MVANKSYRSESATPLSPARCVRTCLLFSNPAPLTPVTCCPVQVQVRAMQLRWRRSQAMRVSVCCCRAVTLCAVLASLALKSCMRRQDFMFDACVLCIVYTSMPVHTPPNNAPPQTTRRGGRRTIIQDNASTLSTTTPAARQQAEDSAWCPAAAAASRSNPPSKKRHAAQHPHQEHLQQQHRRGSSHQAPSCRRPDHSQGQRGTPSTAAASTPAHQRCSRQ